MTQQLREPIEELALRATIPRLTAIDDEVSLRVQRQYEENPYPRWVRVAAGVEPVSIDQYLRDMFPTAPFTPLGKTATTSTILVAGCGTGWHAIGIAQKYLGRPGAGGRSQPQQSLLTPSARRRRRSLNASNTRKPTS